VNPPIVIFIETKMREALKDDEKILEALAALKVAKERGNSDINSMKIAIASFLFTAFDINVVEYMKDVN
jgi:hypothetical protein